MDIRIPIMTALALSVFAARDAWPQGTARPAATQAAPRPAGTIMVPARQPTAASPAQTGSSVPANTPLQTGSTSLSGPATIGAELKGKDLYYCRGFGDGRKLATGRYGSAGPDTEVYIVYVSGSPSRGALDKSPAGLAPGTCGIVGKPWAGGLSKVLTVKLPQPGAADALQRVIDDLASADTYYEFVVSEIAPDDLQVEKFGRYTPTAVIRPENALVDGEAMSDAEIERLGLVVLKFGVRGVPPESLGVSCSGSLLGNGWVLTAAHCVSNEAGGRMVNVMPQSVLIETGWSSRDAAGALAKQRRVVTEIHTFWPRDIALLRIDRPIRVGGFTHGFTRSARTSTDLQPLKDAEITLVGAGIDKFANERNRDGQVSYNPTRGSGRFTRGKSRVIYIADGRLRYSNMGTGARAGGDSGSPSYIGGQLVSVFESCSIGCLPGQPCGKKQAPDDPWQWAASTGVCNDWPVAPVWNDIQRIIAAGAAPEAPPMRVERLSHGRTRYILPTVRGEDGRNHYLDGCARWGVDCGLAAARQFCAATNPIQPDSLDFAIRNGVGASALISDGQVCHGPGCGGFAHITCVNRAEFDLARLDTSVPNQADRAEQQRSAVDPGATAIPAAPRQSDGALTPKANAAVEEAASGRTPK